MTTRITFAIDHARDKTVLIESIPFEGEETQIVDTARITENKARITLQVQYREERPYYLKVSGTDIRILFVHDGSDMAITANILRPEAFTITQSPSNTILYRFLEGQRSNNTVLSQTARELQQTSDAAQKGILQGQYDSLLRAYYKEYRDFADTVSSPGVFLYIYNNVDFGKDYDSLRAFIMRTADRFPAHEQVAHLREKTIDYLKTFSFEFAVGDTLPPLQLPDEQGNMVWVRPGNGQYLFIDFWSSWCQPCFRYMDPKKALEPLRQMGKLEMVSIALDIEKEQWKQMINSSHLNGIHLIDEKVWNGPVIHQWRIDSIPFNFLVDPTGRIIDKAIPADSLTGKVRRYVNTW